MPPAIEVDGVLLGTATPVSARDVVLLQAVNDPPSVSILMTTTPGPRLPLTEQTRLHELVDQAVLRLQRLDGLDASPMIRSLEGLANDVAHDPVDQALALYVSQDVTYALRLGLPVIDRVVVDHTFATRDLVLALQRTPRHVVLVLTAREARLFEVVNGVLAPAATTAFPVRSPEDGHGDGDGPEPPQGDTADFLRLVDRRLGTFRAVHPSPIVVVGPPAVVDAFTSAARHLHRHAGTLTGDHLDAELPELAALTRPVLQRYLASREQEALELVNRRAGEGRVVSGMPAAWTAARVEQPEMLAVEEGLFYPARVSDDGLQIALTPDIDEPDVVDDAVDELIEHVLVRGGQVALVGDGALGRHEGVALTRR